MYSAKKYFLPKHSIHDCSCMPLCWRMCTRLIRPRRSRVRTPIGKCRISKPLQKSFKAVSNSRDGTVPVLYGVCVRTPISGCAFAFIRRCITLARQDDLW